MNYILVSSADTLPGAPQRVKFEGPTYIDCYVEKDTGNYLAAQIKEVLMTENPATKAHYPKSHDSPHGSSYNYTVKLPPLAVLEFLKKYGYNVVGTNTIGVTCIWTLQKST